jgi:hypothetical protein
MSPSTAPVRKFGRYQAPAPAPAQAIQPSKSEGAVSFWLGAIYTFLLVSRSVEFIDSRGQFHLVVISGAVCAVALISSGMIPKMLVSRQGKWVSLLCLWIFLGLPFSTWKGGSVDFFASIWIKSYVMFFIVGGLIFSLKQMRTMAIILALSSIYQIYLALHGSMADDDRLSMSYGTLGNANDLATALLMGLPFIAYVIFDSKLNGFLRALSVPLAVVLLVSVLKTGSRGALVAIAGLVVIAFVRSSGGSKIAIVVVAVLFVGLFATVVPTSLRERYMTIFASSVATEHLTQGAASAIDSSNARRQLFINSIILTMRNPIFGVGLAQFAPQSFDLLISQGMGGMWFTSHDIYALVSAEIGLPGLVFFCLTLSSSLVPMWRLSRLPHSTDEMRIISGLAYSLLMSILAYMICGIFSTAAYTYQLPVLAALSAALERVSLPYVQAAASSSAGMAKGPQPFLNRRLQQNRRIAATL